MKKHLDYINPLSVFLALSIIAILWMLINPGSENAVDGPSVGNAGGAILIARIGALALAAFIFGFMVSNGRVRFFVHWVLGGAYVLFVLWMFFK